MNSFPLSLLFIDRSRLKRSQATSSPPINKLFFIPNNLEELDKMPTTLLRLHPTGRKASFRARQAGLAQAPQAPLPPPPPPTQLPLPQKPRWAIPFIWMTTTVTAAGCFLPDLFCKLTLGPPSRSTTHETRTRYWGMVRKWEEEQDRRAQGGMAWLYLGISRWREALGPPRHSSQRKCSKSTCTMRNTDTCQLFKSPTMDLLAERKCSNSNSYNQGCRC